MKRILSILIHLVLLNFMTFGFSNIPQGIYTITFMITALSLMYEPMDEFMSKRKVRKYRTKKAMEYIDTKHDKEMQLLQKEHDVVTTKIDHEPEIK